MADTRFPNTYVNALTADDESSYTTLQNQNETPRQACMDLGPGATPNKEQGVGPVVKSEASRNTKSMNVQFAVLVALGVLVIVMCGVILAWLKQAGNEQAVADLTPQVQELANRTQLCKAPTLKVTPCTMSVGAPGGTLFTDLPQYSRYGRITAFDFKIETRGNLYLMGFRASYGSQKTDWRGETAGREETFVLQDNEVITGMTAYIGIHSNGFDGLVGISVLTNLHRQSVIYGGVNTRGNTTAGLVSGQVDMSWDELLYFSGRIGLIVDKLEVHAIGCRSSESIFTIEK